MYDHILVPTDGSDHVEPAVEYALDLAQHYDCTVHALHVVDSSPIERKLELTALDDESLPESWHAAGGDATQRIADRAMDRGIQVETEVRRGIPAREIAAYVDDNDIDLVSMGTRGHTGLDRLLLGSVTTRIVRTVDVPVICVSARETDPATELQQSVQFDNILVPTDESKPAQDAVARALDIARTYGATLHGLYVIDRRAYASRPGSTWTDLQQVLENHGTNILEELESNAEGANVPAVTEVRHGVPHRAIQEYAADTDVNLIVMGTHGRSGLSRQIIGSVTERVLRSSDVPVLTTRPSG